MIEEIIVNLIIAITAGFLGGVIYGMSLDDVEGRLKKMIKEGLEEFFG